LTCVAQSQAQPLRTSMAQHKLFLRPQFPCLPLFITDWVNNKWNDTLKITK
jgi:hypothetical protein